MNEDYDEDLAATEEALEAERVARDEAVSEDVPQDTRDPRDHEQEFEDLGFMLAWWAEDNDVPIIDTVSDLANGICAAQQHLEAVRKHGYPEDAMSMQVTLNQETNPLVFGALQILGCLHHHLRPAIRKLLVEIHNVRPVMTEAESAKWIAANNAHRREVLANMGIDLDALGRNTGRVDGGPPADGEHPEDTASDPGVS